MGNNAENKQLNIDAVSCWVVLLNWTTGCESDAESTEVKAVFMTKQDAENYINLIAPKIKWNNYYEGCLDIEEVPFQPCS